MKRLALVAVLLAAAGLAAAHNESRHDHAPGKTGAIVWQFTKPGEFHFGCLVPGHFEAGMVGQISVQPK